MNFDLMIRSELIKYMKLSYIIFEYNNDNISELKIKYISENLKHLVSVDYMDKYIFDIFPYANSCKK